MEDPGLLTVEMREDGTLAYALTKQGERVALQLSMSSEDDAAALLEALLGASEA